MRSEAIDWKNNKLFELRNVSNPALVRKSSRVFVKEILDDYILYLNIKRRKAAKITAGVLDSKIRPVFENRLASSIETKDAELYRSKMHDLISDTTINRHLAYFHAALVHAHRRQTPRKVETVPYFEMADESHNVRTGFVEYRGYEEIMKKVPSSLKPLATCGYHVSTRKGELLEIRWPMVDLEDGVIELEPPKTKNREGRYLPIYGDMVPALKEQKALRDAEYPDTEFVFFWHKEDVMIGHGGSRTEPGSQIKDFRATWKAAVKAAGFDGLLFHDLRRSAQRNMRKAGIDQSIRKKISGHKTDSMERRYNIIDVADIKQAARQMEKWSNSQKTKSKPR